MSLIYQDLQTIECKIVPDLIPHPEITWFHGQLQESNRTAGMLIRGEHCTAGPSRSTLTSWSEMVCRQLVDRQAHTGTFASRQFEVGLGKASDS